MSDSKGAAIDEILVNAFLEATGVDVSKFPRSPKALDEAKQAILALLAQEVKRVIGEDEVGADTLRLQPTTALFERNQLRAAQRRKAGLV